MHFLILDLKKYYHADVISTNRFHLNDSSIGCYAQRLENVFSEQNSLHFVLIV